MNEEKILTFAPIIKEKSRLLQYLKSIYDIGGKPSMMTHRRLLKNKDPEAIFCDTFLKIYEISVYGLEKIILEDFEGFYLHCVVCGKKLKERNILSHYNTCSHKCGSIKVATKVSLTRSKAKESLQEKMQEIFEKYKEEHHLSDEIDLNMTNIKENKDALFAYIKEIEDSVGSPNVSPHYKRLREDDPVATLVGCILLEYKISLGELKYILVNNFESVNFFCKTCGKRTKDVARMFCSVSCEMNNVELAEKRKKTSLAKYGVEHHLAAEEVRRKSRETILIKYGVPVPAMAEEVKAKIRSTCEDRYGCTSSWKNAKVIEKISEAKSRTARKRNFPILVRYMESNDLELLLTEEEYIDGNYLKYRCKKCGNTYELDYHGNILHYLTHVFCKHCHAPLHKAENEVFEFIRSVLPEGEEIVLHSRKIIQNMEIDAYIPSRKLAIEFDGVYWHSSNIMDVGPNYHLNKTLKCAEKGIRLIHIFENEWANKREIVQSIIRNKLGMVKDRIYARDCIAVKLSNQEYHNFIVVNHLQGSSPTAFMIGLKHKGDLVACLGIDMSRFKPGEIELVRFCTKLNTAIIGGMSKLLSYTNFTKLISYLDLRYFDGSGYEKCGFKFVSKSSPGYLYIKGDQVLTRYQCQKHKLASLLGDKFDPKLSEIDNMTAAGYYQLFDCGMLKYELVRN